MTRHVPDALGLCTTCSTPFTRLSSDEYAVRMAETASERSEDPYVKVGTCLLRHDKTVAAVGYNGAPSGVEIDWSDRDGRRDWVIHAEANALRYVTPGEVGLMATTMMPCERCILLVAAYKIPRVVYRDALTENYDPSKIQMIADACGIEVTKI